MLLDHEAVPSMFRQELAAENLVLVLTGLIGRATESFDFFLVSERLHRAATFLTVLRQHAVKLVIGDCLVNWERIEDDIVTNIGWHCEKDGSC